MTEKDYSGATTSKIGKNAKNSSKSNKEKIISNSKPKDRTSIAQDNTEIDNKSKNIKNYKKAGKIAKEIKTYAKEIIKQGEKLVDIAEKIEAKILELGGEIAFPINLSIDDVAAHYTPTLRDESIAKGLLKVDIGVHVEGCICDTAFSLDLTPEKKHSKLIEASEKALSNILALVKQKKENITLNEIGEEIHKTIKSFDFIPIINLSGHGLDEFEVHSGLTIPNYENGNERSIGEGAFAIEPFSTLKEATGLVYDGAPSNIYHLTGEGIVRDSFARKVLEYVLEKKRTLPFSQRELEKEFGSRVLFALISLKKSGAIKEYPQLVEKSHLPVSQAETSIVIYDNKVEVLDD